MMSMEVDLAGTPVDVDCPFCNGEGETNRSLQFVEDPTIVDVSKETEKEIKGQGGIWMRVLLDEPKPCPMCNGSGTLEDVPAEGTISIDPPPRNEGYL